MPAVDCAPTPNATCSRGCLVWAGTARTLADAPQVFRRARDTGAILGRDGSQRTLTLAASQSSRGLLSVTAQADGSARIKQASWRPLLRAPSGKPSFSFAVPRGASLFPARDPLAVGRRFATCAVVGSSGAVLSPRPPCGRAIDQHEAVFRINTAPVRGFEEYVGSRETFRVLNGPYEQYVAGLPAAYPRGWGTPPPDGSPVRVLADVTSAENARQWAALAEAWRRAAGPRRARAQLLLKDHAVLHYYLALLGHPRHRPDYPSTGLLAILVASLRCDSVSLFGFTFHSGRNRAQYAAGSCEHVYHYYERLGWRNQLKSHNLTAEADAVRALEAAGVVRCSGSAAAPPRQGRRRRYPPRGRGFRRAKPRAGQSTTRPPKGTQPPRARLT